MSRAAFETVPAFQKEGSGLGALSLHPAIGPIDKTVVAARATDQPVTANPSLDSFDSAESSGLGLFGDLGLLGSAAYLTLAGVVFAEFWRRRSPEAFAAAGGFAMALLPASCLTGGKSRRSPCSSAFSRAWRSRRPARTATLTHNRQHSSKTHEPAVSVLCSDGKAGVLRVVQLQRSELRAKDVRSPVAGPKLRQSLCARSQ